MKALRNIIIIIASLLLCVQFPSCSSLKIVKQCSHNLCFSLRMPQGFSLGYDFVGEGEEEEVIYFREDSACIYVSSSCCCPNDSNIRGLNDSLVKLRYQMKDLVIELDSLIGYEKFPIRPDTFELHGIDANGMCWKDILYDYPPYIDGIYRNGVNIGYCNVPESEKELFDKALGTFVNKRKRR